VGALIYEQWSCIINSIIIVCMISKITEKELAISLRKKGLTYSEILKKVPVAKSSLSLWLRQVGLAKEQKQRITQKRIVAARRGANARREKRLQSIDRIYKEAEREVGKISLRELWLIGTALYWAEGTKEKERVGGSTLAKFSNSDSLMVQLYLRWLNDACKVEKSRIHLSIYIHENNKYRIGEVIGFWARKTGFSRKSLSSRVYFKKHKPKTNRMNTGESYFGNLTITVFTSTELNRKIAGWIRGICHNYKK